MCKILSTSDSDVAGTPRGGELPEVDRAVMAVGVKQNSTDIQELASVVRGLAVAHERFLTDLARLSGLVEAVIEAKRDG